MSDSKTKLVNVGKETQLTARLKEETKNDEAVTTSNQLNISKTEMVYNESTKKSILTNEPKQKFVKPGKASRAAKVAERKMINENNEASSNENAELEVNNDTFLTNECLKSKADLRKERKAIQEAQRTKKIAESSQNSIDSSLKTEQNSTSKSFLKPTTPAKELEAYSDSPLEAQFSKLNIKNTSQKSQDTLTSSIQNLATNQNNKSRLFHHFDQFNRDYSSIEKFNIDNPSVDPAFIKFGIECANDRVVGSNERCLGFLYTLQKFFQDYKMSAGDNKTISKDLEIKLKPNINFLCQCRPLAHSIANAIKEIKQIILYLPTDITEIEAKEILKEEIERFIDEKILLAWETISKYTLADSDTVISGTSYVKSKITNDDCILIYDASSLITHILIRASRKFPKLRVIVVDSRPGLRGKHTMEQLVKHGIDCTYILINAISFIMNKVTKVLIGAHAILANGYVLNDIGSSQIALVAKSFNVPVVVCCETYKFCDKVQTDALINNELDDSLKMLYFTNSKQLTPLIEYMNENKSCENINLLNLTYDITSPSFISCVITDMGMLPCTSVPVVLRLKSNREHIQLTQKVDKSARC